jgi:DNA-binding transcriptional regulator YhcF (GntR family)
MRVDKQIHIAEVAKELLNNPLQTQREIADNTDLWLWTVNRAIKEVEQNGTKDPRILWICDEDLDIVKLTQLETKRRLLDEEERKKLNMQDLNRAWEVSTKRFTIFKWDIPVNWDKTIIINM